MSHGTNHSSLTLRPLADTDGSTVLAAFIAGFAGYPVPVTLTLTQFETRFRSENLDAFASTLYFDGDEPVAIVLITRRGWRSRVGAMGIVPRLRGTGLGLEAMRRAVADAKSRGDTGLVLEAIESNVRAVKLYQRAGFRIVRRLSGFTLDAGPANTAPAPEIDPATGAARAGVFAMEDLPWQLEVASLAATTRPTRCFGDAQGSIVAMIDATQPVVRLRALAFDARLTADEAAAFTASLRAAFPERGFAAPPVFPDVFGERFFAPGGWRTTDLSQVEMRHPLGPG